MLDEDSMSDDDDQLDVSFCFSSIPFVFISLPFSLDS